METGLGQKWRRRKRREYGGGPVGYKE